jgi:hypothetical protein
MPDRRRLLEMALKGLEADRTRLDAEIAEVKHELGRQSAARSEPAGLPTRRAMSVAARKRISQGMKRRYAELRKAAAASKK